MPKIEVEEAEWNARGQLTQVVSGLLKNPKSRPLMLQAQKEAYPESVIPEIDAAKPVMTEIEKVRTEFADYRKAQEEKETKALNESKLNAFAAEWAAQKGRVRDRYPDFNDKALEEIEKFATEKGIPDFEAAAARYRELNPPAQIQTPHTGGWGFFEENTDTLKDDMDKLMQSHGDNDAVTNHMVNEALADIRGRRAA